MASFFRSKYLWLSLLALVAILAYISNSQPLADEEPGTSSTTATGDGIDDFGACKEDARNYCSGFYSDDWQGFADENGYVSASWKLGLVDCLEQNRDLTSEACHDSLDRRATLNEELKAACGVDRGKYCQGVEPIPGSEPMVDCLKANYEMLTEACAVALDAHEASKPQ